MASEREFRSALMQFVASSDVHGTVIVLLDTALWIALATLAILADSWWIKLPLALVAGMVISSLFVLGHDAAHGSLVRTRWLNEILSRVAFLPALHNTVLWRIQHNRLHHQFPNVKGLNSWSPLSPEEFRALPAWRQLVERIYRSGLGTGPYYLVERWWKHKLFPRPEPTESEQMTGWIDFAVIVAWLAAWIIGAIAIGRAADKSAGHAIIFGVVIPYAVWNTAMGLTVFVQHTHPRSPWFATREEAYLGQERRAVHVECPRWVGFVLHDIMEHPAHHLNPLIPSYRLRSAQAWLNERLGDTSIRDPFTPRAVSETFRKCKLYDYQNHRWVDFEGNVTSSIETPDVNVNDAQPSLVKA